MSKSEDPALSAAFQRVFGSLRVKVVMEAAVMVVGSGADRSRSWYRDVVDNLLTPVPTNHRIAQVGSANAPVDRVALRSPSTLVMPVHTSASLRQHHSVAPCSVRPTLR